MLGRCSTERDNCESEITGTSNSLAKAFKVRDISDTSCCLFSRFFDDDVIDLTNINSSRDLPHKEKDEKELDDRNKIYSTILENYSKY